MAGLRTFQHDRHLVEGLLLAPSQPIEGQWQDTRFVLDYRCGAVPEFHRIPFCSVPNGEFGIGPSTRVWAISTGGGARAKSHGSPPPRTH